LARFGFEIVRLQRPNTRFLQQLIRDHGITLLLDVGANQGQYAIRMRTLGYRGRIFSYEPGSEAFGLLARHARNDPDWRVFDHGLGSTDGTRALNISGDSVSSSFLKVSEAHILAAPNSTIAHTEAAEVRRLDSVLSLDPTDKVWLKLDTQGSENEVLSGAQQVLEHTEIVQTELSLVPCYDGQAEYTEIFQALHSAGFRLIFVEPGTQLLETGEMLQFDGIFARMRPRSDD
jgi:FkbM family methyltransferase